MTLKLRATMVRLEARFQLAARHSGQLVGMRNRGCRRCGHRCRNRRRVPSPTRRPGETTAASTAAPPDSSVSPCVLSASRSVESHSCAILSDGTLRCWGNDFAGELGESSPVDGGVDPTAGVGHDLQSAQPVVVSERSGRRSASPAGGPFGSARLYDNDVTCAFTDQRRAHNLLGVERVRHARTRGVRPDYDRPSRIRRRSVTSLTATAQIISLGQTSALRNHRLALLSCWGQNNYRAARDNRSTADSDRRRRSPVALPGREKSGRNRVGLRSHLRRFSKTRTVACWGYDFYASMRDASRVRQHATNAHVLVSRFERSHAHVALGSYHSCARHHRRQQSQCWGYNYQGSLGNGSWDGGYQDPTARSARRSCQPVAKRPKSRPARTPRARCSTTAPSRVGGSTRTAKPGSCRTAASSSSLAQFVVDWRDWSRPKSRWAPVVEHVCARTQYRRKREMLGRQQLRGSARRFDHG